MDSSGTRTRPQRGKPRPLRIAKRDRVPDCTHDGAGRPKSTVDGFRHRDTVPLTIKERILYAAKNYTEQHFDKKCYWERMVVEEKQALQEHRSIMERLNRSRMPPTRKRQTHEGPLAPHRGTPKHPTSTLQPTHPTPGAPSSTPKLRIKPTPNAQTAAELQERQLPHHEAELMSARKVPRQNFVVECEVEGVQGTKHLDMSLFHDAPSLLNAFDQLFEGKFKRAEMDLLALDMLSDPMLVNDIAPWQYTLQTTSVLKGIRHESILEFERLC